MSEQYTTNTATAAERTAAGKRRGQALIGAAAGVAVIAVLIGTFAWVQLSENEPAAAPAAAATTGDPRPAEPVPTAAPPAEDPAGLPTPPALKTEPVVKGGTGAVKKLTATQLIKGTGPAVAKGQTIAVNYTGVTYKTGKKFDSSWQRGQPFTTQIGVGSVIPGWDQGLVGVPVGSRVQLDIPAALAYGDKPQGGAPAGDLRFVVDILAAQ
jgi:peptidylprolyl isomerase